ncbi:MAG: FGGY family carbohydrate kinase [Beutenbergiaceae bacterium]
MSDLVLALDCGTHAVRVVTFDADSGQAAEVATADLELLFPAPGWVEIDPHHLASTTIEVLRTSLQRIAADGHTVIGLGITDMRETAFAWDKHNGQPLAPGVLWMSLQSQPVVDRWRSEGREGLIRERTGLTNDTFFFGSKIAWLLEQVPQVAAAQRDGRLAVGTVDSWLIHVLTGGREHRTDTSNASRTQVLSLDSLDWDAELAAMVGIDRAALPLLTDSAGQYGTTDPAVCGAAIPITGVMADQQASLLGHGGETPGSIKATFGTSGVVCANTGASAPLVDGLVTSVGWTGLDPSPCFEVEGSAFHSGYTVTWLREKFGVGPGDGPLGPANTPAADRVYLLPSFTRLGAPRWPERRGAVIAGLGMDTEPVDVYRAGVEAMAFQVYDMIAALGQRQESSAQISIDGGGSKNDYLCQVLADLSGLTVVRPAFHELTSAGVAKAALAGLGRPAPSHFGQQDSGADYFTPTEDRYAREGYDQWTQLIEEIL